MILSACLSFASGENIDTSEDQKKVDELNDKILIKANDALDEAMEQLDDAKSELPPT